MENERLALVLGASGGVGGAIADALLRHGWTVRAMARDVEKARRENPAALEWVTGDAMDRDDVVRAASGVRAIVHAVNPPGYRNWQTLVLPMIDNTIAAARAANPDGRAARVVLPGTVYNYDPSRTPLVDETTPQQPANRKGAVRVELERRLERAAPEVPSLILRAGDFFGPGARSSWFTQAMIARGKPVRRIVRLTRGGGHSWAYLPDLAEAFARLMDAEERLAPFERLQFEGLYDETGAMLTDALRRVAGRDLAEWRFPWWLMRLLSPFGGFPREAAEIAPFWQYPMRFDNRRLVSLIGSEPRTDLDVAVRQALVYMECLESGGPT